MYGCYNGNIQLFGDLLFPYRQRLSDVTHASLAPIEPIDVIGNAATSRFNKASMEKKANILYIYKQ